MRLLFAAIPLIKSAFSIDYKKTNIGSASAQSLRLGFLNNNKRTQYVNEREEVREEPPSFSPVSCNPFSNG